ncbi:hypothetical protein TNCV_4428781 [Trichonephila clavipes]|nr:hypothetical protein TNCV_4428781 [Trichonephila clavipes]
MDLRIFSHGYGINIKPSKKFEKFTSISRETSLLFLLRMMQIRNPRNGFMGVIEGNNIGFLFKRARRRAFIVSRRPSFTKKDLECVFSSPRFQIPAKWQGGFLKWNPQFTHLLPAIGSSAALFIERLRRVPRAK